MASALGIALALWLAPPQAVASDPAPMLCDIAVRSETLDYREFADAAEFRLSGVRLREAAGDADPACVGRLHGYVELRRIDEGVWELSLIASDGRAWFRTITSEPDQAARSLASALANLIAAIEEASVEPDAHDVALPAELEAPVEPEPVVEPEPTPIPEPPETTPIPDEQPPAPPPDRAIVLEVGPRLSGAVVVGLAPGPGLRGGGGGFGLDLRLPDGLGFGLDVRALHSAAADVSLIRTRIALGVGWIVRSNMFELPVLISGAVEPWIVREAGRTTPLGQPPMIGGGIRVAPGLRFAVGSVALRVGALLGLEIAFEPTRGALAPAIARDPISDPFLRAGGVELAAGLELGVWIPVRERSSTRRTK